MNNYEDLSSLNYNDIPLFSVDGVDTLAVIHRIYDGDTFRVTFHYGEKWTTFKCRLSGVDTPEIRSRDKDEKILAELAKMRLIDLVNGKVSRVILGKFDKYGRVLTTLFDQNDQNVSKLLIDEKLGYAYNGNKKNKNWTSLLDDYKCLHNIKKTEIYNNTWTKNLN